MLRRMAAPLVITQPKRATCSYAITPCHFSPLAEIPGAIDLLENSLTFEGVQWRKIMQ